MKLLRVMITFVVYSVFHDVVAKAIYCKWKMRKNNGYKCYYWTCKHYHTCPYNGNKSRLDVLGRNT